VPTMLTRAELERLAEEQVAVEREAPIDDDEGSQGAPACLGGQILVTPCGTVVVEIRDATGNVERTEITADCIGFESATKAKCAPDSQ